MFIRLLHSLILSLIIVPVATVDGQNIVPTNPQNKRAVLEEFGGIYCTYCPEGNQISSELSDVLGEDLIILNYHSGFYALPLEGDPDFRSDYGEEIITQADLLSFPSATINRLNFPEYGGGFESMALNREVWLMAAEEVMQEQSPVNIAAEATLNIATRELVVYIEYYYTADAPGQTNRLNVAILQNNVLGPQHGSGMGDYYSHQYLVRDFLTGQWGHTINNTDSGSFGSLTYNFTLPLNYRDVPVDPFNIKLAAFIGEDQRNVLTGIDVTPVLTSTFDNDVNLLTIYADKDICGNDLWASILVRNDGNQVLESMDVSYLVEGSQEQHFSWTGDLQPFEEAFIQLPVFPVPALNDVGCYDFFVNLDFPNEMEDFTAFNNEKVHSFCVAPEIATQNIELAIRTDDYGYDLYWEILDDFNNIYASGGNLVVAETGGGAQVASLTDAGAYPNNSFFIESIELPTGNCYRLRVLDDFGDGICCLYGSGFFKLREPGGEAFIQGGEFNAVAEYSFMINNIVATTTELSQGDIQLFPNPVKIGQDIQLLWPSHSPLFQWQLFDLSGRLLSVGDQDLLPKTDVLFPGYYIFHVQSDAVRQSFSLIVQ